jgi:hypothetical protein
LIHPEELGTGLQKRFFDVGVVDPLVEDGDQRLPIRRDAPYKRDQVARPHDVHRTTEEVRCKRSADECRVAAIGAAVDSHPLGVGNAFLDGPPYGVHKVVVHPRAPLFVTGVEESLAVAGRASVVDLEACVASVGKPLGLGVVAPQVPRPRATVHVQNHRQVLMSHGGWRNC